MLNVFIISLYRLAVNVLPLSEISNEGVPNLETNSMKAFMQSMDDADTIG